jgi:signal transduction histidine kinase
VSADELDRLREENAALRSGRLDLVRELNRVIALGDFALRCASAEDPGDVLDRALLVLTQVLALDSKAAFGLDGSGIDTRVFAKRGARAGRGPGPIAESVVEYVKRQPVANIVKVGDSPDHAALNNLLDALFPDEGPWDGTRVVLIPLRPRPGETSGAMVAVKHGPGDDGPEEADATFLVLLSNHVDRALQSALLVADLKARGQELAEGTRRFRESLENLERTQKQLLQARKLEAIGRLAGGVAHDFNNLLTVIRNHVDFLSEKFEAGTEEADDVTAIGEAVERATRITRQLLAFGRRNEGRPEVLDLNRVGTELTRGIGRLVGEHVAIELKLEPTIPPVRADRAQLEQVFLNLLVNARDAMSDGGIVRLSTRHATLEDLAESDLPKDPTQFVALTVEDTGCGMDEATRARLFEPFFTTKGPGQGTGLGLATVYGIVEKHGGHIAVHSTPGQGTTFTLLFPTARRSSAVMEIPAQARSGAPTRTATILLVEDDAGLRRAALRTLTARGYTVLEARDGEEALQVAAGHAGEIQLVVTDVVMPRMAGPKLVSELRLSRKFKVIYVSGYTFDMLDPRAMEDGSFLSKPFSPDELLGLIQLALAS